jgi:hypothetical protein
MTLRTFVCLMFTVPSWSLALKLQIGQDRICQRFPPALSGDGGFWRTAIGESL